MALQYRVPENIDIEDKVIGPLTIKQFGFMFAAFAVSGILYQIISPDNVLLFLIFISPMWMIAALVSFYRPNDRPMDVFIISGLTFLLKPRQKIWKREVNNIVDIITKKPRVKETSRIKDSPAESQLEILARLVDTEGWGKEGKDESGRITSPAYNKLLENTLVDPLEEKREEKHGLMQYIEKVTKNHTPKNEPSIQDLSSVSPDTKFTDYKEMIPLADNDIIAMAKSYHQKKTTNPQRAHKTPQHRQV